MKKSYLMIAAVALFAACASNDTISEIDIQEVPISFDGKFIDKATRAELTNDWFSNSDENHFGVYGFKGDFVLYTNEDVHWNNTKNDWEHSTVRFWDKSANNYSFYAHAPYSATHTFTDKKYSFTSLDVIKDIATENADIAIATPMTGISYGNCTQPTATTTGHGEGHVEFTFNHILSKLAFKVKTSVEPQYAEIKVREVKIDFPTGTATWAQSAANAIAGATTYSTYTAKDGIDNEGKPVYDNYETPVFSGTTDVLTSNPADIVDATTTTNKAKTFIVTPVATTGDKGLEHVFGIVVTYDVQYKKLNPEYATDTTKPQYINDGNPETGCKATGVIGGDPSDATKQYKPAQNSSYVVTIDVNPAQIEFCVNEVVSWTSDTPRDVEVE